VPADDPPDLSGEPVPLVVRRGRRPVVLLSLAAMACLVVAVAAGTAAHADLARKPTASQRAAAAAEAVADRWRSMPAGRIFPATLSYSTSLLTTETANRVGIAPQASCAEAIDPALARIAARDHCKAAVRATYLDELQGVVYTIGVLAFPSPRAAGAFAAQLPAGSAQLPASSAKSIPLLALALPDTASSRFSPRARQATTVGHVGPFVVLTVAGYADGQPAGTGQEARPSVFAPAAQLAGEVIGPMTRPVTVNCASREWSC
jgi:hypothetical protein